jgi:signal transduction histidine kinase
MGRSEGCDRGSTASADLLSWMEGLTNDTHERMLATIDPDDRKRFVATVAALTPENSSYQISYRVLPPDGNLVWLEESGRAFFNSQGKLLRMVSLVADVSERKLAEEIQSSLSRRLIEAQERERHLIARELHDDVNQRMALLQIRLEQFELDVPSLSSRAREQLRGLADLATKVSSSIHNLSRQLHPPELDILGLGAAVRGLCRELSAKHSLQIQFAHHGIPGQIPKDVTLCLFRIAQQALYAIKHSGSATAEVELSGRDDQIELSICASGAELSPESAEGAPGLAFISMQERLRLVGGQLSFESLPSHGARIRVRIPTDAINQQ